MGILIVDCDVHFPVLMVDKGMSWTIICTHSMLRTSKNQAIESRQPSKGIEARCSMTCTDHNDIMLIGFAGG